MPYFKRLAFASLYYHLKTKTSNSLFFMGKSHAGLRNIPNLSDWSRLAYPFPLAAIINCHNLGSLKQQKFIVFIVLEARGLV